MGNGLIVPAGAGHVKELGTSRGRLLTPDERRRARIGPAGATLSSAVEGAEHALEGLHAVAVQEVLLDLVPVDRFLEA